MIETVCVCGAGTMGAGIALTAAQHGFKVILFDLNKPALDRALEQVYLQLDHLVERQKISATAKSGILQHFSTTTELQDCRADLIIEAIVEKPDPKITLFRALFDINSSDTLFASNTSSLSITDMAAAVPDPSRLMGLHFFNPPTIMKLVELVETKFSTEDQVQRLLQLVRDMGKTAVRCKDIPGFIVNRVARPYYIEALRLAESGMAIEDIDLLMESTGFRMGPFRLMDLIGNDINYAVSCSVYEQLGSPERLKPSFLQQQKLSEGKLGRKSGAGFYSYPT